MDWISELVCKTYSFSNNCQHKFEFFIQIFESIFTLIQFLVGLQCIVGNHQVFQNLCKTLKLLVLSKWKLKLLMTYHSLFKLHQLLTWGIFQLKELVILPFLFLFAPLIFDWQFVWASKTLHLTYLKFQLQPSGCQNFIFKLSMLENFLYCFLQFQTKDRFHLN